MSTQAKTTLTFMLAGLVATAVVLMADMSFAEMLKAIQNLS
ncbi:hypothetical protein [Phyllobacterium sp. 628]|nr:hypothetical protein [Phyllobacterium sp. 628]